MSEAARGQIRSIQPSASSTDNAFARFDGATGKKIKNSQTTEDASGNVTVVGKLGVGIAPTGVIHGYGRYINCGTIGTPTASTTYAGTAVANLFDGDLTTIWGNTNALPAWVKVDHGAGVTHAVERYRIYIAYKSGWGTQYSPKDFKLKGSNVAAPNADPAHVDWTDLDTQTGISWDGLEWKEFTPSVTTAYRHHCIYITAVKGGTNYVTMTELELLASSATEVINNFWIDPATGRIILCKADTSVDANVLLYFGHLRGQVLLPTGGDIAETLYRPSLSFVGYPSTGIGNFTTSLIFSAGGTDTRLSSLFFYRNLPAGFALSNYNTVAYPTYSLTGDPNTGIYFPVADNVGIVCGGAETVRINTNILLGTAITPNSATKTLVLVNGTAPTTNVENGAAIYACDIAAGHSAVHIRNENSTFIKLYQQAHIVDASVAHGVASWADVDGALDALGTIINTLIVRRENQGFEATA